MENICIFIISLPGIVFEVTQPKHRGFYGSKNVPGIMLGLYKTHLVQHEGTFLTK